MKPFLAYLGKLGICLVMFLDDMLVICKFYDELLKQASIITQLLMYLGFVININKSILKPTKNLEFLGMNLNSETMLMSLSHRKVQKIIESCATMHGSLTARKLASFTGMLVAALPAVKIGTMYYRSLCEQTSSTVKTGDWDSVLKLNP